MSGRAVRESSLGPLQSGQRVIVIGGGPAGVGCAITLLLEGRRLGREAEVVIFEAKHFGEHYNQCLGVLSPPFIEILRDNLVATLPRGLVQREIRGYVLHASNAEVVLDGNAVPERSHAVRRAELDRVLLARANRLGARLMMGRATDLEITAAGVTVYGESGTCSGDVVIGAFGTDPAIARAFSRATAYRPPRVLETVVTKVHPAGMAFIPKLLGDRIHVFLPSWPGAEFAAVVPKGNHVSVIVAGPRMSSADMQAFLATEHVKRLLPRGDVADCFKGTFPISPARGMYGDRYVTVGDAAGLVRPYKGKGINSALITGSLAARTMLQAGISRQAFSAFRAGSGDLIGDLWYGRAVRLMANFARRRLSFDALVDRARTDSDLRSVLFDIVSGHETYRNIVRRRGNVGLLLRTAPAMFARGRGSACR